MKILTKDRVAKILQGEVRTSITELKELEDADDSFRIIDNDLYVFSKETKSNKIWDVEKFVLTPDGRLKGPSITGFPTFSFDKKKIYHFSLDYPQALTHEEKALFDKENPYWAKWAKSNK